MLTSLFLPLTDYSIFSIYIKPKYFPYINLTIGIYFLKVTFRLSRYTNKRIQLLIFGKIPGPC